MNKALYVVVPTAILFSGINFSQFTPQPSEPGMKDMQGHLSGLRKDAPDQVLFCHVDVPVGNPLIKDKLDKEIQKHLNDYAGVRLLFKRSLRYRKVFQEILRAHGVPEDMFYLSMAESALTNAISPKGAKGFWQFMETAADEFGLEVSQTVDERYHPEKSTIAASKYFLQAYDSFGDWSLVAASYNMGRTGLYRAMEQQQIENYFTLDLNAETSHYLYRILGIKIVLEEPHRFGLDFEEFGSYDEIPYRSVKVNQDIPDLAAFAKEHGVSYPVMKLMNPWLISHELIAKPGKMYEIRFPLTQDLTAAELVVRNS